MDGLDQRLWHILMTLSGEEAQAGRWLTDNGDCSETFYPVDVRWRPNPITKRKLPYSVAAVPGYLFGTWHGDPDYSGIKRNCRHIIGWMQVGERPVVLTDRALMQMQQVPAALEARRSAIERAKEEARTFRVGDTAEIEEGPLAGWTVTVMEVHGGIIVFDAPIGKGTASVSGVRKVG